VPFALCVQVEGDSAKLSDGLLCSVRTHTACQQGQQRPGQLFSTCCWMMFLPLPMQQLSHSFTLTFKQTWQPHAQQPQTDTAVAAAVLDSRYKHNLCGMPAADILRGQRCIEQLASKALGPDADVSPRVSRAGGRWGGREVGCDLQLEQIDCLASALKHKFISLRRPHTLCVKLAWPCC
jgi:hypothetical protein